MRFINPIEILRLETADIVDIDISIIKKAKRKLFADIDLSDNGHINYKGLSLTKTDCEKAIDELSNLDTLEFYSHLRYDSLLNEFLVNGNEEIFHSFKQESIYKLPDFVNFISPYFVHNFDKALLKSFKDKNGEKLRMILRTQVLISAQDWNLAFKSLSIEIQHRLDQIDSITREIKNEESEYSDDDISDVIELVKNKFPIELLNQLPPYFQSQTNKIAASINFLQLAILKEFNSTSISLQLLEFLLELNIESVSKPTFQKNLIIVKKRHEERIIQEKNAPILKKWASILITLQSQIKSVEANSVKAADALDQVKYLISIPELNSLPVFANEIRTQIGYSIRSLSISCWNKQNDITCSLALINFALLINVGEDAKLKIKQDKSELEELEKKYRGILVCHFCESNTPVDNCAIPKTIYKESYRSYFPRKVEFSYITITIPRCQNCKLIHSKGSNKYYFTLFSVIILGVIIGSITNDEHFILGGIIGAIIGHILGKFVEGNQASSAGIKDVSKSTLSKHPLLIDRTRDGWTFSKPSA